MKSSELLFLQDIWRQAFRKGDEGMTITFPSRAGAVRGRMQLYNAVKQQKAGQDMNDMELVHAAEQLEIVWVGDGKESQTIRLQRRAVGDMMKGFMGAMGKGPEAYIDPDAQESANRMLKELERLGLGAEPSAKASEPEPGEHQDNPFYGKREGF